MIRAPMTAGQALFVQISYHPGWKALVRGERIPIRKDGLGLMLLEPHCDTPTCEVDLIYDGGVEMLAAWSLAAAALAGMILWCGYGVFARR